MHTITIKRGLTAVMLAFALALTAVTAAFAGSGGHGHTPVVVCHNVTHNPHIIVVDNDSTKLQGHLKHRTQPQLMDLVEGYDGTADQIRARCVKRGTPPPTITTTTGVPSSTTTTSPTSSTSSSTTSSPSTSTSSSTTSTTSTSTTATSSTTAPVVTTRPAPSTSRPAHSSPGRTANRTTSSTAPRLTTSPRSKATTPGELAFTGLNGGWLVAGLALVVLGLFLWWMRRKYGPGGTER